MPTSFLEIAEIMDSFEPPRSMRGLAERHRWLSGKPPAVVSLREIAWRHKNPATTRHRFLEYNTFLMRVRLALAKGLADAATPWEVMDALGVTPRQLLKEYDVCQLLPSGPGPIPGPREACQLAGDAIDFVIDFIGGVNGVVSAIIDMFGAEKVIETVLRIGGVPDELVLKKKPALKARAREIGDVLRHDGYDVVALCETWNDDLRDELIGRWQLPNSGTHLALGKAESNTFLGDGLLLGSTNGRIVEVRRHEYDTRGIDRTPGRLLDMLADDELWAKKAVLLVRISVGVGVIDLYLSHLYYGTGLAGSNVGQFFPHIAPPSNGERKGVRSDQLKELSQFMNATHRAENVAVVCGDFNIDANGKDPNYAGLDALQDFLSKHHLQDRWLIPHEDSVGATGGDFSKICAAPQPRDVRYCLDTTALNVNDGYRIDLILVEEPHTQHSFMLDITRVRRRSFPRLHATEGQAHMSDHLGLDCTFVASPTLG
jgi:hypothetical protein